MKEVKDIQIKVRVTKSEKEMIEAYCANNDLTVSTFLRLAINELMGKEVVKNYRG